jgi:catechol 2,3-dioxygenase-like lactoylglutathione lyase family enzyme
MTIEGLRPLLQVFDMPTAVRFYCDVLGFGVLSRSPTYATQAGVELFHWALLKSGDAELMLNTAYDEGERPAVRDRQRQSAHGDTELYFDCPDLDEAYAHLKTHGVPCIEPRVAPYGMRQLSFADPDGYGITLQHRV